MTLGICTLRKAVFKTSLQVRKNVIYYIGGQVAVKYINPLEIEYFFNKFGMIILLLKAII